jgi:hypothetical protein
VTAVGGTTLSLNGSGTYAGETVWSGTGSGCSAYEPKPSWQHDSGCARRTVADVAADADPNTGAAVYDSVRYQFQSGWFQVGGTSLASPLIAAVFALSGNTSDGSAPYAQPGQLHDVTAGSNGSCGGSYLCTAGPGYDGPTGLGTPNGLGAFSGAVTPDFSLSASPTSRTVTQGTDATYTVSLAASGGYTGSAALSVSGLPAGTPTTFQPGSVSAGTPSTLTVSTGSLAAGSYTLTITGSDGTLSHTTTAALTVQTAPVGDFSISISPSSRRLRSTGSTTYIVTVTSSNGFSAPVSLTVSGLPSGVSGSFSPSTVNGSGSSTLTVTASHAGSARVTFTVTGTSGSLSHSVSATLRIR